MTRPLLGFPLLGQSNSSGRGRHTYPIRGQHWRFTPNGLFETLNDESGNQRVNRVLKGGTENMFSMEGALCDSLEQHGVGGTFATIPCAMGGTSSTEWVEGLTVSPTPAALPTLIQAAKLRIHDFLRCTRAVLGAVVIYQGETNANATRPEDGPLVWQDHWNAICDQLAGLPFAGSKKFVIVQLPPTQPHRFDFTYWAEVRAAQEAFVASVRSEEDDCVLVTAPENALVPDEDHHLDTGSDEGEGLRRLGSDVGAAIAEQFGIEAEDAK